MDSTAIQRIVFLGFNSIGEQVLTYLQKEDKNQVVGVIKQEKELAQVESLRPDLIISGGFRHVVPGEILKLPRFGAINMHKSYLPYNRGANPNVWSIIEENPAGVSLHYMDKGIDTGDIIAQERVEVEIMDTAKTLYDKLEARQLALFQRTWPLIKTLKNGRTAQPHAGTFHNKQDFKDLWRLDLEKKVSALKLINLLRALTFPPFLNAYYIKPNRDKIYLSINIQPTSALPTLDLAERALIGDLLGRLDQAIFEFQGKSYRIGLQAQAGDRAKPAQQAGHLKSYV